VIDGNVVMQNRKFLTVDEDALLVEAGRMAHRCAERAGIELPTLNTQIPVHA
jgi:hypothetical protein